MWLVFSTKFRSLYPRWYGVHQCLRSWELGHLERHHHCIYAGFTATCAPINISFSKEALAYFSKIDTKPHTGCWTDLLSVQTFQNLKTLGEGMLHSCKHIPFLFFLRCVAAIKVQMTSFLSIKSSQFYSIASKIRFYGTCKALYSVFIYILHIVPTVLKLGL